MKILHLVFTAVVLTMLTVPFLGVIPTTAAEEEEIMVLIETAETPEDHIKIAEYYKEQAMQMEKMASMHKSMGESYRKRSKPMSGMAKHCADLSKESRDSAKKYNDMAAHHMEMAQSIDNHGSHEH